MRRLLLAVLVLSAPISAQIEEPAPLSGPKIAAAAARATLVERDFEGRLRELEVSPEESAIALLNLDAQAQRRVDAVLAERAAVIDRIVSGNLELLVRLSSAMQAEPAERVQLVMEASEALKPLRHRGPLLQEIGGVLPEDKAAELNRLVVEYRAALRDDILAESKSRGENLRPAQVAARMRLAGVGQEIRRSYDRLIAAGTERLERTISRLNLTPEQDGKVRNLVFDFFQQTMGKATESQKRELFVRLLTQLDAKQRRELMRMVIQER